MKNAFEIVRDFENAVAEYTGAPYCVAVNSCTNALFLALRYSRLYPAEYLKGIDGIHIPKKTYISVPMQIKHAGYRPVFYDLKWSGVYRLNPTCIWDAAKRFTSNMFKKINFVGDEHPIDYVCVSFHWAKILGIQQGGAIIHNDPQFDIWARKARFDGRTEGVKPKDDNPIMGWHMYMSPEIAAQGLVRLMHLPKNNPDLPMDDYPDLSQMDIFK